MELFSIFWTPICRQMLIDAATDDADDVTLECYTRNSFFSFLFTHTNSLLLLRSIASSLSSSSSSICHQSKLKPTHVWITQTKFKQNFSTCQEIPRNRISRQEAKTKNHSISVAVSLAQWMLAEHALAAYTTTTTAKNRDWTNVVCIVQSIRFSIHIYTDLCNLSVLMPRKWNSWQKLFDDSKMNLSFGREQLQHQRRTKWQTKRQKKQREKIKFFGWSSPCNFRVAAIAM